MKTLKYKVSRWVALGAGMLASSAALAATELDPYGAATDELALGDRTVDYIAVDIINLILGFLGLLAVIIILIGGFKWLVASGNEEKVEEAKKTIIAGIIGLVIILASWGIARFVIDQLITSTTG